MTDEVREAAERYERFKNQDLRVYNDRPVMTNKLDMFDKDAHILADAYLAARADPGGEREALLNIAALPHSNPTGDTLHGPCPKCIAMAGLGISEPEANSRPVDGSTPAATQPTPAGRFICACGWEGRPADMRPNPSGSLCCPECGASGGIVGSQPTPAADAGDIAEARAVLAKMTAGPWEYDFKPNTIYGPKLVNGMSDRIALAYDHVDDMDGIAYLRNNAAAWLERLAVAEAALKTLLADSCADDTAVRNLARPVLGAWVDGDKDYVPAVGDIVEKMCERLAAAEAEVKRLAAIPAGIGRTITRPVFPIDPAEFGDELARRRAVPAGVHDRAKRLLEADPQAHVTHYYEGRELARWVMELAAGNSDDGLPVDEAWLRSVGFTDDGTGRLSVLLPPRRPGMAIAELCFTRLPPGWSVILIQGVPDDQHEPDSMVSLTSLPDKMTRGDVRRLCQCLGIALAAGEAAEHE